MSALSEADYELLTRVARYRHGGGRPHAGRQKPIAHGLGGPVLYRLIRLGFVKMDQFRDGSGPFPAITKAGRAALAARDEREASAEQIIWQIFGVADDGRKAERGIVYGADAAGALDALAMTAGCASHAAACAATGERADDWTTDPAAFAAGGIALLVEHAE